MLKKSLVLLLTLCMVISLVPMQAWASDGVTSTNNAETNEGEVSPADVAAANDEASTNVAKVTDTAGNTLELSANSTVTTIVPEGNDFNGYTGSDAIWGETWGNASESFVIKVLDANGNVMGTTTLKNVGGIIDGDVGVTWNLKLDAESNTDEYWTMEWTTAPSIDNMPAKVELWVDGVKVSGGPVVLNGPDGLNPAFAAVTDDNGAIKSFVTNDGFDVKDVSDELNAALAAGGNVVLLRDVTVADTLTVPANATVVLDLNGKTISQTKECTGSYSMIENNGSLTITGNGKLSFNDTSVGDPTASWGSYTIRNAGTLVVENGTVEHLGEQNQAGKAFAHTTLAIFQYSGSTTINGGTVSTPNYRSIRLWSGDLTINGGTFDGQVWVQCVNDTAKLTIKGGNFSPNGNDGSSVFVNNSEREAELNVIGGRFETKIGADAPAELNGNLIIGGTFTEAAVTGTKEALLGEGFDFIENGDGTYTVREIINLVIKVSPVASTSTITITVGTMDEAVAYALANGHDSVVYQITGPVELTTGFAHGLVDLGVNVVIEGITPDAKLTIVGGGVPDIKGVTFKNITLADEGEYLPTANEFMYQNYIDCTFDSVVFEDGVRLSGNCTLTNCTVNANTTNEYAIWLDEGNFTIEGTTVTAGNDAYGMIKSDTADSITIKDNTFEYLGNANKEALNVKGATIVAEGNTFIDCTEGILPTDKTNYAQNGNVITNDDIAASSTVVIIVAKIGDQRFATLADALAAAQTMSGDVVVEIYDKVTLNTALSGNFDSIKFVGMDTDAEIYLDVQGYITATGKKVAFENLILSKSAGTFITNAGFMNVAFGIYDVTEVTYTNCTFANGAYASSGNVTYNGCTFQKSHEKYGLWAYGDVNVTVSGCTFDNDRGIKMYAEGAAKTVDLTVENTDFSKLTGKPAIVLTYGESVTLEDNNTYSSTGVFELDLDGVPNGTVVNAPASITCKNDNGACGVLVDGKIYTTVADAAAVATSGSTVTLLHNSTETVKLAEGVTLNKNGYDADGVSVMVAVATIGEARYGTLQEALDAAAAGSGNVTVEILNDIDLTGIDWTPVTVSAPGYPMVTVNGNGKTITGLNDMLFAGTWAGGSGLIINDLTIKKANIVNDENDAEGTVGVGAFIGFPQASATITLNKCHLVDSTVKGGHWTGGLIGYAAGYAGTDGPVFMNLTIKDCSVTGSTITGKGSVGGIIGHATGNAWTNVAIETTTVSGNTVTSTGSSTNKAGAVVGTIGAAGQATTVNGVEKTGGVAVSATVSGNTVKSNGTTITTVYGRQGSATGILEIAGGSYDNYPIEENVAYAAPVAGYKIVENTDSSFGVAVDPAYGKVAMIGDTYYATLEEAIKAAAPAGTVELLADVTVDEWIMIAEKLTIGDGSVITLAINGMTINGNGHTITIKEIVSPEREDYLFYDAANLNIKDLTIKYVGSDAYDGGIGLKSGTISNVTFIGGKYAVLPGNGGVTIKGCKFEGTTSYAIYFEDARSGIVVNNNTFNTASGAYAITMRDNEQFTNNTIVVGRVNLANSAKSTVTGNDFGTERFKVYNEATATITGNKINNLVFNDASVAKATFNNNTLSESAKTALDAVAFKAAEVNGVKYATLEEAFKAATEGCTIEILADVVIDGKWDCRDYATNGSHSQFKESVTINGNDHTIKFTGTINDNNWNTVFRFEENATVNNLTIDISEATGVQRVITAKKSLTVDGLTIIGSAKYGIIFGEGANATDLAATEIIIENSTLTGTRRAISDNEGGKDVKSIVITDNILNAEVNVSASESIIFNNNVANDDVKLVTYAANNVLDVEAQGNTLTDTAENYTNANGTVNVQAGFTRPARGEVAYRGYIEDSASREAIKVDLQNVYATTSVVVKLYDANGNLLTTTTLKEGAFKGDWLTTNIVLSGTPSGSWNTEIHEKLTVANVPTKVELYIDGDLLDTFEPALGNITDAAAYQLPAYLALDCVYKEAKIGDTYYATLADALAAAEEGDTVTLLADIELTETVTVPAGKTIVLDLNGKTVTGRDDVTYGDLAVAGTASLTITDSSTSANGKFDGVLLNYGTLTIAGGTVTSDSNTEGIGGTIVCQPDDQGNLPKLNITGGTVSYTGNATLGMAISAYATNGRVSELNISGGTITSTGVCVMAKATGSITGGTFTGKNLTDIALENITLSGGAAISGGTFNTDVSKYLAEGYELKTNDDGTYGVAVDPAYGKVAKIGDTYYESITEALAVLQANGGTLELLADASINASVVVLKDTVINGNGKKLTVTDAYGIDVQAGVNLTINNLTVESNLYALNLRGASDNATVEINNSYIKGYGALNIWGTDVTVNVNDSTLHGHNSVTGNSNAFAAIVLNARPSKGEISNGTKVNVTGGKIITSRDDGCEVMGVGRIDSETGEINISDTTVIENNGGVEQLIQYAVARHGDAICTSLQAAIDNAAAGEVVTLLRNVTVDTPVTITKNVVIDGNDKTLTYTGSNRAIDVPNTANGANVTIKNLTLNFTNGYSQRGINYNTNGKLTLDNVTVNGADVTYAVNLPSSSANAEVEINNSSITGLIALNVWGANAKVDVTDTNLTSVDEATHENYAAVKLNNNGTDAAEGAVINITGGSITAKDENGDPSAATTNATATGVINISGTTTVNGNSYEYVAAVLYNGASEFYGFASLQDAIDKAENDPKATVKLLKDIELSEILVINGAVTIDGNGKKITSTAGRAINIDTTAAVTIENLTIVGSTGCERGINIINQAGTTNLSNVKISGVSHYAVHVATSAGAAKVNIADSELSGYAALAVYGAGSEVAVSDSALSSVNEYEDNGSNSFATIVIAANNAKISVEGGSVSAEAEAGKAPQAVVSMNAGRTNMTLYLDTELVQKGTATLLDIDPAAVNVTLRAEYADKANAEGYAVIADNDMITVKAAVARIGNVNYATLQDAENAAKDGETIVLLDNIVLDNMVTFFNSASARMVTLNMNGKTITMAGNWDNTTAKSAFWVCDGLTVTGNGTIKADPANEAEVYVFIVGHRTAGTTDGYVGNLVIENGTFYSNDASVVSVTNGSATINGGTFESAGPNADGNYMTLNCIDDMRAAGKASIVVYGGTFASFNPQNNAAEGAGTNFVADGYVAVKDGDNYIVRKANYVAEVNGTKYESLADAFAAADGKTVTLIADVTVDETVTLAAGKTVTLNLNGKTINAGWNDEAAKKHVYVIDNKGTLTITGNGVINTRGIYNYGELTLESGTINAIDANGGYAVQNLAGSIFTMNGGTVATTNEDGDAPGNGYDATTVRVEEGAEFVMNGGTINNISNYTFAIDNHGTVTVKAGNVTSVHTTVANYGTATIDGGEFTCNGLEGITAHAVWAAAGTTTINGGTFNGKDNYNGFNVDASAGATVIITGGTFEQVHSGSLYGDGTIAVSGGTFADPVAEERCADGFIPTANADGTYGVKVGSYVVRNTTTGVGYETLQAAISAAKSGETVALLKDMDESIIMQGSDVTLDLNGYTLTANYLVAFNGTHVIDSSDGSAGLLKVAKDNVTLAKNNAQMPVWNGEGYRFFTFTMHQQLMGSLADNAVTLGFWPELSALDLLAGDDHDLMIGIRITYEYKGNNEGASTQDFIYSAEKVKSIYATNGTYVFALTLSGVQSVSNMTITSIVISQSTGLELTGEVRAVKS